MVSEAELPSMIRVPGMYGYCGRLGCSSYAEVEQDVTPSDTVEFEVAHARAIRTVVDVVQA